MNKLTLAFCVYIPCVAMALAAEAPAAASAPKSVEAITRPSDDRTLAFVRPGLIAKILVKDGDMVKVGQKLMQLADEAERAQYEQLEAEAEETVRIEAAEAELAQKKVDLQRTEEVYRRGGATELEVQHAKLEKVVKVLSLRLAKFQQKQARRKLTEARAILARMTLISPVDGRIERIVVKEGEAAEALTRIIRLVKIDPLWLDVPVPLARARKLVKGGLAEVVFSGVAGKGEPRMGKIVLIRSEADAGSDTLEVRVEVPNPTLRPAGEHVHVIFPVSQEADGARKEPQDNAGAAGEKTKE